MAFHPTKKLLLFLSFTEGSAVMATELIGAKMLAPYFGSSLYIWAIVMAITLGALACGYFIGGLLSAKSNGFQNLLNGLIVSGVLIALMPVLSSIIIQKIIALPLIWSCLISSFIFLFPPIFCLGVISPLIINLICDKKEDAGKYSGLVYAVSTVGGISFCLLTGLWIIPTFGLALPAVVIGIVVCIPPIIILFKSQRLLGLFLLIFFVSCWYLVAANRVTKPGQTILFSKEGLLGQVQVVDQITVDGQTQRFLLVNQIVQSMYSPNTNSRGYPEYQYLKNMALVVNHVPKGAKILSLGLGGGTLQNELSDKGYDITACEFDANIVYAAKTHFNLRPAINVKTTDARYYVRKNPGIYGAIVSDLYKGEQPPEHCYTQEAFTEIYQQLQPDGVFMMNLWGYTSGRYGKGVRSIYRTLEKSGFLLYACATDTIESNSNLLLVAYKPTCPASTREKYTNIPLSYPINLAGNREDYEILTDAKPALDKINLPLYKQVREYQIQANNR